MVLFYILIFKRKNNTSVIICDKNKRTEWKECWLQQKYITSYANFLKYVSGKDFVGDVSRIKKALCTGRMEKKTVI